MDTLTAITSRVSAVRLMEPGPSDAQLDTILKAGARGPDHGRLAPWRFIVIEAEARHRLGEAFASAHKRGTPDATAEEMQKEAAKALRAPTIIAIGASIQVGNKIPVLEQIVAVGAATQNMFLAAHALGMGAMWQTGIPAYDPGVKRLLDLYEQDMIVGVLYLGRGE